MDSSTTLLWGLIFGSIGFGYFLYGKKQRKAVPLIVGLCLMAAPYFVPSSTILVAVCLALMAVAYFVRIQ